MSVNDILNMLNTLKECNIDINQLEKKIEKKLKDLPIIMVYGVYNSGKSTLVNALIGRNEAKVSDIPTTDEIKKYEYNGYKIYDTPGINAPILHQKISENFLKEVEVVLFVMSNDSSVEEKIIYEKIKYILDMRKKVILVLNNKTGSTQFQIKQIEKNLKKFNINLNLIKIVLINAKTALKGRLENKKLLIEKSNIKLLEEIILKSVKKEDIYTTIEYLINSFIQEKLTELNNEIDDEILKEKEELITNIIKQKELVKFELFEILDKEEYIIKHKIKELLFSEEDIHEYLDQKIEQIQEKIEDKIDKSVDKVEYHIEKSVENIEKSFEKNVISEKFAYILKNKELTEKGLKTILLKLRSYKFPKIKGRWEKTLSKWSKKGAIIIEILVSGYELYEAFKMQKEYEEREKNKILEIENISTQISYDIISQFKKAIIEILNEMYENILKDLNEEKLHIQEQNENILKKIECLKNLTER